MNFSQLLKEASNKTAKDCINVFINSKFMKNAKCKLVKVNKESEKIINCKIEFYDFTDVYRDGKIKDRKYTTEIEYDTEWGIKDHEIINSCLEQLGNEHEIGYLDLTRYCDTDYEDAVNVLKKSGLYKYVDEISSSDIYILNTTYPEVFSKDLIEKFIKVFQKYKNH